MVTSIAVAREPETADQRATEANITRATTSFLARSQLSHHPLDTQVAGKLLDRYMDALDGTRSLFLRSDLVRLDLDELGPLRATLAERTRVEGDTQAARVLFSCYLERLRQQVAFDTRLLRGGHLTFEGQDRAPLDRRHADRPADLAAAQELWRQQLRAEVLEEKLAAKPARDIAAALIRRHQQHLKTMTELGDDEVLELYLDALAHVYDPHSDYLGKQSMESLSITMNLSLVGIGVTLADGGRRVHDPRAGPGRSGGAERGAQGGGPHRRDRAGRKAARRGHRRAAQAHRGHGPRAQGLDRDADDPPGRGRAQAGPPHARRGEARRPGGEGAPRGVAARRRPAAEARRRRAAVFLF